MYLLGMHPKETQIPATATPRPWHPRAYLKMHLYPLVAMLTAMLLMALHPLPHLSLILWSTQGFSTPQTWTAQRWPSHPLWFPRCLMHPDPSCSMTHPYCPTPQMVTPLQRGLEKSKASRERGRHQMLIDRRPGPGGRLLGPRGALHHHSCA